MRDSSSSLLWGGSQRDSNCRGSRKKTFFGAKNVHKKDSVRSVSVSSNPLYRESNRSST